MFVRRVDIRGITDSDSLVGQSDGRAIADEIERQITAATESTILFVDFSRIRCATLASLRTILQAIGRRNARVRPQCSVGLRFDNASRDVTDSLTLLFRESRKALLAVHEDDTWEVLGPLTASEQQTIEILMGRESVTSVELSSLLGIKLNAASTRLKKLYDRDLATRHENATESDRGRRFVYQRLHAGPHAPAV